MASRDIFDSLSPADYRYYDKDAAQYLSEHAFIDYKLDVECALVRTLCERGLCSLAVLDEVERACTQISTDEVYAEERRIGHDIRALVNCIRSRVSDEAKPFVHLAATSYDIVDTANALRFRDVTTCLVLPLLVALERTLVALTEREAATPQIGRTHGQHAVPITFGFALASYVNRLGDCIQRLELAADELTGKFSGAVGAYNALSLFVADPEEFEAELLGQLDLLAPQHSTQIAPPEPLMRLLHEISLAAGVMANLADDLRHLQRSEIAEVGEAFGAAQVGSSTMPQKRNPITFENIKSLWKVIVGRLVTVSLDQLSEHQRDLTGSASGRTYGEIVNYAVVMAKGLNQALGKLQVDRERLAANLAASSGLTVAEPLYLVLASLGHPDAHEKVRGLTLAAERERRPLAIVAAEDQELAPYFERMSERQRRIITGEEAYLGRAEAQVRAVAEYWRRQLRSWGWD